ncbi:gly-3 [Symbiodinium microadriaticum]|nr:gly-3 [Symbiodinium microadriaticum]
MLARMEGVWRSDAPVTIFLDSHIEATRGWIEPILARIAEDKRHVVVPSIDTLGAEDMVYRVGGGLGVLGFSWTLGQDPYLADTGGDGTRPAKSPVMAGGLFASDTREFLRLGGYDPEMRLYGGEEMEIGFRTWMCGGDIEYLPCSHVGHIFRTPAYWKGQVYKVPGEEISRNKLRTAEVWMDEYKSLVQFASSPLPASLPIGDLEPRRKLREKLQCKDFRWYLQSVTPHLFVPKISPETKGGALRNQALDACLDTLGSRVPGQAIGCYPCHGQHGTQAFVEDKSGLLRVPQLGYKMCLSLEENFVGVRRMMRGSSGLWIPTCTSGACKAFAWRLQSSPHRRVRTHSKSAPVKTAGDKSGIGPNLNRLKGNPQCLLARSPIHPSTVCETNLATRFVMPRFVEDGTSLHLTAESILDKVGAATSMAAELKEFGRALAEEFAGTTSGDDFPCCCCELCLGLCEACCRTSSSGGTYTEDGRRRKPKSLLQAPGQEGMDEEQPSLLERIARLSSEDLGEVLRHTMKSEKWTAKEQFGLWLFEKKFGQHERKNLEKCVEAVKKEAPVLMEEDHVTTKDVDQKKNSDSKVAAKFVKLLAATSLTKHGAQIASEGLGAVKLQHCEPVLCAGDLKYKLDQTGLHQCTWNCPSGQVPALFQSVGVEMMEELEEVTPLEEEKKEVQKAAKEMDGMASSPKEFEKSEALSQVNKLKLRFHEALGNNTLKLSQTASPTNMGAVKTSAIRYHGKCSPPENFEGQLKRAVLFQGDKKEIPKGSVVEVTRLPATSTLGHVGNFFNPFSSNMKDDEVEVTYQGKDYVVKSKDLQRTAVGKVSVDEGLQDWLLSTGDTIKVQMPPKQQDPKEVLWFPVDKDKSA